MDLQRSRSRRVRLLGLGIVTLLFVGIAAGCGGAGSGAATGGQAGLSQAEFVTQGNAICSAASARIAKAAQALPQGQAPTGAAAQTFMDTILAEGKGQADAFLALKPPAELQADVTAFATQLQAINDKAKAQGADAFFATEADPYKELDPLAKKLGLTACMSGQ